MNFRFPKHVQREEDDMKVTYGPEVDVLWIIFRTRRGPGW